MEKRIHELQFPSDVMKGFALFFSLMFVLLLTLLGFCLLVLASEHYSITHHLFEKENSRLACESAVEQIVERHNLSSESPRFFFDSQNWQGTLLLRPFSFNGYSMNANLGTPWSSEAPNRFLFTARKGSIVSQQYTEIRQMRLEDFALYSEEPQVSSSSSLFAGSVFVRGGLQLTKPVVRFLGPVYSGVQPAAFASYQHPHSPPLEFPALSSLVTSTIFRQWASQQGIMISGTHPSFWKTDHYELVLNQLQLEQSGSRWKISYSGGLIGESSIPLLFFDGPLTVYQTSTVVTNILVTKPKAPLYVGSSGELRLESEIGSLEDPAAIHPIALVSGSAMTIGSAAPTACRINAILLALGSKTVSGQDASFIIEAGGVAPTEEGKRQWISDLSHTEFLMEDEKRESILKSLQNGEKMVWFQSTLVSEKGILPSPDLTQLHFRSSKETYSLFPSFPFVFVVQGSRQWL
jgi:hypothetical protein